MNPNYIFSVRLHKQWLLMCTVYIWMNVIDISVLSWLYSSICSLIRTFWPQHSRLCIYCILGYPLGSMNVFCKVNGNLLIRLNFSSKWKFWSEVVSGACEYPLTCLFNRETNPSFLWMVSDILWSIVFSLACCGFVYQSLPLYLPLFLVLGQRSLVFHHIRLQNWTVTQN